MSEIDLLIQELRDTIDNQREEIERLNNIINELEKFLENEINLNNLDSYTLQKIREYLNFKCYELRKGK